MGAARELFESHLSRLQELADETGKHLAEVLLVVMGPHALAATFGIRRPPSDLETMARALAETYRARYIEEMADSLIRMADATRFRRRASKAGGNARGLQLTQERLLLREEIVEMEAGLLLAGVPAKQLTKLISTALDLQTDYVKKVRTELKRGRSRLRTQNAPPPPSAPS